MYNSAMVNALQKRSICGEAITPLQLILLTAAPLRLRSLILLAVLGRNWIADALSRFNISRLTFCELQRSIVQNNQPTEIQEN